MLLFLFVSLSSSGDVPAALTIHYVSQEVKLDEVAMTRTPLQVGPLFHRLPRRCLSRPYASAIA